MYVVVEFERSTGEFRVLYPRGTLAQVHNDYESACKHRDWYISEVYVEDPEAGHRNVRIFRLDAVEAVSHESQMPASRIA